MTKMSEEQRVKLEKQLELEIAINEMLPSDMQCPDFIKRKKAEPATLRRKNLRIAPTHEEARKKIEDIFASFGVEVVDYAEFCNCAEDKTL